MATEFSVDLDHLDQVVARLSGLAGYLTDQLDQIDDRVATLRGTGWESVAARAYSDAHRVWADGAREFVEGVQGIRDALQTAHEAYTEAADVNSRMMRGDS